MPRRPPRLLRGVIFAPEVEADAPQLSYARAVEEYKADYARRYQILMHGEATAAR